MSVQDADIDEALRRRGEERIGVTLNGKYRLDRVIGSGGMAVVYEATHRNQKQFAVKMLHPELAMRPDIRARFLREGYAANSVKHPGAVAVLDDDVASDGAAFLVMELLDGAPLENVCAFAGGRLGVEAVLGVAFQLADVLAAAHAKDVVHRDIKPANLFLTRDGQIKVLDFGIARVRDAATGGSGGGTGSGFMMGTPAFMAPEQANARSNEIDGQTDVWAIGATMFTLLAGRTVHVAENAGQLLIAAATQPPPSTRTVVPDLDAEVAELIDRALARDRSQRWPSAIALRDAIGAAHARLFGGAPTTARLADLLAIPEPAPSSRADTIASGDLTAPEVGASSPEVVVRLGPAHSSDTTAMADTRPSGEDLQQLTTREKAPMSTGLSTAEPVSSSTRRNATTARPALRSRFTPVAVVLTVFLVGTAVFLGTRENKHGTTPGDRPALGSGPAATVTGEPPVSSEVPSNAAAPSAVPSSVSSSPSPSAVVSATAPITRVAPPPASNRNGDLPKRPPAAAKASASAAPCKMVVKQTGLDPDGQPHFAKVCE